MTASADVSAITLWYWRQMATCSKLLKRDNRAVAYWERIAAARPDDAATLAALAHLKAATGKRPEAVELLRASLRLDATKAGTWYNLGYLQQEEQRHEEAIESFDRAIALNEKLDLAYYGKALSLIKTGRLDEAIPPLKKNTELQPMSPFGFYQLAHVYHRLQQPERVARMINKLSVFEPQVARQLERETGVVVGEQMVR
jgi:tetratricopeptide (TPR) repeat protein